jgi:hypothetical protein
MSINFKDELSIAIQRIQLLMGQILEEVIEYDFLMLG